MKHKGIVAAAFAVILVGFVIGFGRFPDAGGGCEGPHIAQVVRDTLVVHDTVTVTVSPDVRIINMRVANANRRAIAISKPHSKVRDLERMAERVRWWPAPSPCEPETVYVFPDPYAVELPVQVTP